MNIHVGRAVAVGVTVLVVAGAAAGVWGVSSSVHQSRVQAVAHQHALVVAQAEHVSRVGDQTADQAQAAADTLAAQQQAARAAKAAAVKAAALKTAEHAAAVKAAQEAAVKSAQQQTQQTQTQQTQTQTQQTRQATTTSPVQSAPAPAPAPVLVHCPAGSQGVTGTGGSDTSCLPSVCFHVTLPDPNYPQCVTPFKP